VAHVIDFEKFVEQTNETITNSNYRYLNNVTPIQWGQLKIVLQVLVEVVNAELKSRVEQCDTQILERAMCAIGEELVRRGA